MKDPDIIEDKRIRVCALMLDPYDTTPGQRFRIEQWEPYLENVGIDIDYFSFADEELKDILYENGHLIQKSRSVLKALFRRFRQIRESSKYDVVYLYRTASYVGPAIFERLIRLYNTPIIFDFDDAIYLTNTSDANKRFGWLKFSGKTADICRLSKCVTVGNSYLAQYARQYSDNVYVVPTSIDTNRYQPFERNRIEGLPIVIGWTGSSTSQYHLEAFEPILVDILKEHRAELKVISDRKPDFKDVECVWQPWSAEKEVEITSQMDIGIMPIPNDEWSKGKCAAKALQYMALGIPAVCSNVGANREVIAHGENGFLADTPEEWVKYIGLLINDEGLRERLGKEARKTIIERYSMKVCAQLFADAVFKTLARS